MRYELKRIEIWSVIKIIFIVSLFIGFLISVFYAGLFFVMSALGEALAPSDLSNVLPVSGAVAIGIVVFGTIGLAILYTLMAIIFVGLYNLIARLAGGITVHFESLDKPDVTKTTEEAVS